jgi:hypothetical protein
MRDSVAKPWDYEKLYECEQEWNILQAGMLCVSIDLLTGEIKQQLHK